MERELLLLDQAQVARAYFEAHARLSESEAASARDAYLALDENGRASIRVFLASLSRQPKLFMP